MQYVYWWLQLAAANGDMRRALEACTAALELKVKEAAAEQADMIACGLSSGELLTQPTQSINRSMTCVSLEPTGGQQINKPYSGYSN